MSRWQVGWLHVSVALTTITGVVYAIMKYLMTSGDEFAVVNHPLQPHMLAAHVVVAPLVLFILGWTFSNHMLPKYRYGNGENRKTGIAAMWLILPMTLSGYLLQVSSADATRQAMMVAHWIASALFVAAYIVHLFRDAASEEKVR